MMHSRWARVWRGTSAATFATVVAAFSHVVGGGYPPTLFALVVSLMFSVMACVLLAGRTLSLVRLSVSVAISQALFHALFGTLGAPVAAAHGHGSILSMDAAAASSASANMWLAHAVAALFTIAAFRYAEQAFWGLATTAALVVRRATSITAPVAIVAARLMAPRVSAEGLPRALAAVMAALRHRGPPAALVTP
jgi:hypothetical protein